MEELQRQIEELFALADAINLRHTTRKLEQLVRQVEDVAMRRQYEAAIDNLPDIVAHDGRN
ncbi:MAG: hypothetical protein JWM80_773 [Cyanobacteria bacterium RYN_339]|nr:hypothetical protein [Cyanobacteria bacterium RYN_339]